MQFQYFEADNISKYVLKNYVVLFHICYLPIFMRLEDRADALSAIVWPCQFLNCTAKDFIFFLGISQKRGTRRISLINANSSPY